MAGLSASTPAPGSTRERRQGPATGLRLPPKRPTTHLLPNQRLEITVKQHAVRCSAPGPPRWSTVWLTVRPRRTGDGSGPKHPDQALAFPRSSEMKMFTFAEGEHLTAWPSLRRIPERSTAGEIQTCVLNDWTPPGAMSSGHRWRSPTTASSTPAQLHRAC